MKPLTTIISTAFALPMANIDTDQLIPARFMKRPRSEGYGSFLLHDLRHAEAAENPVRILDDPAFSGSGIVVARRNFGCGSSREAAVYALFDFGIRCVIAPSYSDIFASNAVKNGLLPAVLGEAECETLLALAARGQCIRVDLEARSITAGANQMTFTIDPVWREQLLNGWDDIDLTSARKAEIEAWRLADLRRRPWTMPGMQAQ